MSEPERVNTSVVFWDFDGTLARREGLWSGAVLDAVRRIDPASTVNRWELKPHLGSGFPWHRPDIAGKPVSPAAWWNRLRPVIVAACTAVGIPAETATAAVDHLREEFYRPDAWTLVDNAVAALTHTRDAGYRNVILSNHAPELPHLVDQLGLAEYVERTITSAMVGAEKPHPAIFQHAITMTHASVTDSWMIGDNPVADVHGARNAGLSAILADGGYPDAVGVTILRAAHAVTDARSPH